MNLQEESHGRGHPSLHPSCAGRMDPSCILPVQGSCGSGAAVMPPLPGSATSQLWQRKQLPGGLFWETFAIFDPESPLKSLFFSPLNNSESYLLFNESLCA